MNMKSLYKKLEERDEFLKSCNPTDEIAWRRREIELTIVAVQQLCLLELDARHALTKIVTDEEIDKAWGNARFGGTPDKRNIIIEALLKVASGYANGHTVQCIIAEIGLVGKSHMKGGTLTKKGKEYLYEALKTYVK